MDVGQLVMDGFELYQQAVVAKPLLTNMGTGVFMFGTADAIAQTVTGQERDWKQTGYWAAMGPFYGAGIQALVESGDLVQEHFVEGSNLDRPWLGSFAKGALGPNLWGVGFNAWLLGNTTVAQKANYGLQGVKEVFKHYWNVIKPDERSLGERVQEGIMDVVSRNEFMFATLCSLTAWNAFFTWNYEVAAEHMQTPYALTASLVWTVLLAALGKKTADKKSGVPLEDIVSE